MVDKNIKSNICHLPWTAVETTPLGFYRPCCIYTDRVRDENGDLYTTRKHSIEDVMNSDFMRNLRKKFLNGERPPGCKSCWKVEDAGNTSKRQHMWNKARIIGESHIKNNHVAPRFIDLKFGNICNLKCRICSEHSSSQWVPDMIKLNPSKKETMRQTNVLGSWPKKKSAFLDSIDKWLPHVRFLEITGGEPLMIQEQFDILQKCIDIGVAEKIDVHYNTNGTQFPEKAIKRIWPHFKRIELAFSIDDIGDRFEYQRTNAKWHEVNDNINKFKNCGLHNLSTQICTTINVFNIFYIDELSRYVKQWNPDFWYINVLHDPKEFDIQMLPLEAKQKIVGKLAKGKLYKDEMREAINYLRLGNEGDEQLTARRKQSILSIDKLRKENFKEIFPELNDLIRIYE